MDWTPLTITLPSSYAFKTSSKYLMMDPQNISSFLLHPLIFCFLEHLVFIIILGFTSADSILRLAVLPPLIACVWKVISILPETIDRVPWTAFLGATIICKLFAFLEPSLISKWTFEAQGPTSSVGPNSLQPTHANRNNHGGSTITTQNTHGGSFWERCRFGYFVITSDRNIGTPHVVKNVPPFSSDNPSYIPSRPAFLLRKAISIILAFLIIDLASQAAQPLEHNKIFFSAEAVPILMGNGGNLTFEKIISRLAAVLGYWVCSSLAINLILSVPNFVFVALGIEDVRIYRPIFGSIGEAYSVRQFWG